MSKKKRNDEAFHLLCGKLLGVGSSRRVYVNNFDENSVVKVDNGRDMPIQNILEFQTWEMLRGTDMGAWLAPCLKMSYGGRVLVQSRTTPAGVSEYPDKIPAVFVDTKRQNFGMLNGEFVCHDYGFMNIRTLVGSSKKMSNVEWWDASE